MQEKGLSRAKVYTVRVHVYYKKYAHYDEASVHYQLILEGLRVAY